MGKSFWHGSVDRLPAPPKDQVFDSERMVEFVRNYLKQCLADGNCVIVGRGAACALAAYRGLQHLRLRFTVRKIRWFEQHFPEHPGRARAELEATDSRREEYIRRYYDRDWTDRRLYHMMINSCMGCDAMIEAVLDGAGMSAVRQRLHRCGSRCRILGGAPLNFTLAFVAQRTGSDLLGPATNLYLERITPYAAIEAVAFRNEEALFDFVVRQRARTAPGWCCWTAGVKLSPQNSWLSG